MLTIIYRAALCGPHFTALEVTQYTDTLAATYKAICIPAHPRLWHRITPLRSEHGGNASNQLRSTGSQ